jgi:hypothetical protein
MSRYREILEGASLEEVKEGESGQNYYGAVRSDGSWVIVRETTASGSLKYAAGNEDFQTNFSNRASLSYFSVSKFGSI